MQNIIWLVSNEFKKIYRRTKTSTIHKMGLNLFAFVYEKLDKPHEDIKYQTLV